ncbi:MAG: AMP-binding protein, partial [Bacteroidota bacterium]
MYILQDANAGLIITDDSFPLSPTSCKINILIPDWSMVKNQAEKRITAIIPVTASDLAYVLYTSGSTGNPKGVMIEHGNLNYYVHWFCQGVIPETGVGLPLTSSFIFAAAVTQFYSTLLSGKTLHIMDPMMIRQPGNLLGWYAAHPQMGLYCVPTLWSEILNYLETSEVVDHKSLASFCVYLSGEAVTDDLLKRSFRILPHLQLWNLYGPTEATANLTACRLYPGETAHIGKPLNGTTVFIVGDDMKPVETGITGELLASGEGIARGYLNLPELTGTTFFTASLNGGDPVRVYRSGDLVKEDESGRLIYVGRKDQQVKIRGFRIELPEIENTLLAIPEVKNAVVKVVEERQNGKRLVAYLVYKGDNPVPVNELRKILMRMLPDFVVPEVFVRLEHFPQFPNGKVDRKSLPLPGIQRPELGYPVVPPSTTEEKTMVRIWEEVLGLEGIGMEDNFFDLGGNSLKANEIALEIQAGTGVPVLIKSVFESLTPGALTRRLTFASANRIKNPAGETGPLPDEMAAQKNLPQQCKANAFGQSGLSENQKALWFIQQIDPGFSAYNIFYSIKLTGLVDVDCLETALQGILNKHETLRTRFLESDPHAGEFAHGKDGKVLEIIGEPNAAPEFSLIEALDHARKIADHPFNLVQVYPFRFILYKLDKDQCLLAFIVHHIVFDGISFGIFLKELPLFYHQAQKGIKSGLAAPTFSYAAFCSEEKDYLSGLQYEDDRLYWQKQLLQAPVFFEVPTDYVRPETPSREGGQIRRTIHPLLKSKLKNLSDLHGASMFMSCLSAFSILLFRHTGQNDFLIGIPVANRVKKSFLSLIGYFVNTMLFRARINPDLSFGDWLTQVKDCVLENLSHSRFPLSHMSEALKTERIQGINPFFQIMFAYHETGWDFSTDTGINGIAEEQFFGRSKFDIFTEIFDRQEDAEIVITFSTELYQNDTVEILLDHYMQIMENICVAPETRLSEISLLSTDEFNRTVYEWNRTAFLHNIKGNVADLIIQQIENTPDLPALVSRHEVVSYREMGEKTDKISANLLRLGVERGMPVGIHLENSPAMVMCILAVFRAGGIYIPLDPYYPEERLRYVIEKTRIRFLIVDEERKNRTPQLNELIIPVNGLLAEPGISLLPGSGGLQEPADMAYIMFTSGSTGNPKGVMIRHDSLLNFLVWMKMELNVTGEDTFLSTTSINFDISFLEIFTPLISGARLVLEKRSELQAPEKVEAILNEMHVNTVQFVPSGLKALCDAGVLKRARYLKNIISGGEKLSWSLQEHIFRESDGKLINLYGPTEATVYMACWHCRRNSPLRMVPIGYPIFNSALYILNENLQPVAIGITGEVYLGGQVLAEGYF